MTVISADLPALDAARARFAELSAAFAALSGVMGQVYDDVAAGAGEWTPTIRPGAAAFLISWRQAFGICHDDAGLIAANIGANAVDLTRVDQAYTTTVVL